MKRRKFKCFAMSPQLKMCLLVVALFCLGKGYYLGKAKELEILSQKKTFVDLGKGTTKPMGNDSRLLNIDKVGPNSHNKMASYAKGGNVPDAKTASRVAYAILCAVYGENVMTKELPLQVYLENEKIWRIEGTPYASQWSVATIL